MLFALYTAAGGIVVSDLDRARPRIIRCCWRWAQSSQDLVGTTCASMMLIRPLLQANAKRRSRCISSSSSYSSSPISAASYAPRQSPAVFRLPLRGVDFFWPLRRLWPHLLFTAVLLLAIFYAVDSFFARRELQTKFAPGGDGLHLTIRGLPNFALIVADHWRDPDERFLASRHCIRRLGNRTSIAGHFARRCARGHRAPFGRGHTQGRPRRQPFLLGADQGSRKAFRRDLRQDHSGNGNARGEFAWAFRARHRAFGAWRRQP